MEWNHLERFLQKANAGEIPLGTCITFTDPAVTELAAASGFDFCWIDGEHGELDRQTAMLHIMALRGTGCAPLYRVPACSHTEIKKVIDFAPAGIIIPMVMNAQDAELAVAACRYPPRGNRGCGFRRGNHYFTEDTSSYLNRSLEEPLIIIQIEHIEAVRNLDEILRVPGLQSILIGPYDLSTSMGKPGQWNDPDVSGTLDEICRKTRSAGILLGAYAEGDFPRWISRGVQYMGIANDTTAMLAGFQNGIRSFRNAASKNSNQNRSFQN